MLLVIIDSMTLTHTTSSSVLVALNIASGTAENNIPEWVELVPAGTFEGRDGRLFKNLNPPQVIANTVQRGVDIPWDVEHATEVQAPEGLPAPAQSWIKSIAENFEIRDGAIWGRVDWKPQGMALVQNDEYRYYSPAFYYNPKTGEVLGIKSIGFTNTPNLSLTALNHEEHPVMDLSDIAAALGLNSEASAVAIIAAIHSLKDEKQTALNRADHPDASQFVPKATYDLAINRAETAETALAEKEQAAKDVAINAAVDAAIGAGKIAPANKAFYITSCQAEGGLAAFKTFVESAPVIVSPDALIDEHGKPKSSGAVAMNAAEKEVASQLGISAEDWAKEKETK